MMLLSKDCGYISSYKLTDTLHSIFGFRTDYEFITKSSMRSIVSMTQKTNSTNTKTATELINAGFAAVLPSISCQRWDYNHQLMDRQVR